MRQVAGMAARARKQQRWKPLWWRICSHLGDIGGQMLIGGVEFLPPGPRVAALTAGEVGGEIFDVDLVSCPVGGDLLQGQAAVLDDQDSLVAVGGERRLDDAVRFVWGSGQDQ